MVHPFPDRFSGTPEYPHDVVHGNLTAMKRVQALLGEHWQQFQLHLQPNRQLSVMNQKMKQVRDQYMKRECDAHEYAVRVLEVLNQHGEPLTGALMDEYGINSFALTYDDFDRVCLDFINAQHEQRMIVDPDSVPEELPMSRAEVGDHLKGTLQCNSKGLRYLQTRDAFPYLVDASDASLVAKAEQSLGKSVRARIVGSTIQEFSLLGS